jgi:hypothetical protein
MPSTADFSDCDPHRIMAREQRGAIQRTPSPIPHRRVDSSEIGLMGTHFPPPTAQASWPRPTHLEIVDEAPTEHSKVGHPTRDQTSPPGKDQLRGVVPPTRPRASIRDDHHCSEEDVAAFKYQRDTMRNLEDRKGMISSPVTSLYSPAFQHTIA